VYSAFTEARAEDARALVRISRGFDGKVRWTNLDYRGIAVFRFRSIAHPLKGGYGLTRAVNQSCE